MVARDLEAGKPRILGAVRGLAQSISGIMAGMGIAAGGMMFMNMIRAGEIFNRKMRSSLAIMGDVSDALRKDMREAAFDAARATQFSASEAAESFYFLASAGLSAEQSIMALPQVAQFAQAGMFSMARATDLATDAQSALGMTVTDAQKNLENLTHVTDVLVKANTLANASVEQFSMAITTKAGAAAKIVGKDIEELTAVLAAFADQGVKSSEAGSAVNIVFRDLQSKALENKKAFADAGVAVFDSTGAMRNMADIVGDLEKRLSGMSAEGKKSALMQMGFADKSMIFLQTLIGTSEKIREYEKELRKASGTTKDVAAKQLTPFQKGWAILTAETTRLASTIMTAVGPAFGFLGKTMGSIFVVINGIIQGFMKLNEIMGGFLGRVVKASIGVIGLAKVIRLLGPAARLAGIAIRVALAKTGVGILVVALGMAVAGIASLISWLKRTKSVQDAIAKASEKFRMAWERIKQAFTIVVKYLVRGLVKLMNWLGLTNIDIRKMGETLSEMLANAIAWVADFVLNASEWFVAILQNWKGICEALPGFIKVGLSYALDIVVNFGKQWLKITWGTLLNIATAWMQLPKWILHAIQGEDVSAEIGSYFTKAFRDIGIDQLFLPSERTKRLAEKEVGGVLDDIAKSKVMLEIGRAAMMPEVPGAAEEDDAVKKAEAEGDALGKAAAKHLLDVGQRMGFRDLGRQVQDALLKRDDDDKDIKRNNLLEQGIKKQDELIKAVKEQNKVGVLEE